jgi:long-chain acyl-CoA synthetase
MTLGDDTKPFVAALININAVTLGRWAEQNGVAFTTFADLSQNARILELIARELRHVNALLPEGSRIRRFVDFPKELDPDEDELTRTRKLRRKYLEQKYASFIDAIYGGKSQVTAEIPVKYQDGRIGRLNAVVQVVDVEPAAPVTAAAGTTAATGKLSAAHG